MPRSRTPSFTQRFEVKIFGRGSREVWASTEDYSRKMYNAVLGEMMNVVKTAKRSTEWRAARKIKDKEERSLAFAEIKLKYGLFEYHFSEYVSRMREGNQEFKDNVGSHVAQKIVKRAWKAASGYLYAKAKRVRFKSKHDDFSFEGQNNETFLRAFVDRDEQTVNVTLRCAEFTLALDKTNPYHIHAIHSKIKYVRALRKKINGDVRYFFDLILEGLPYQDDEKTKRHRNKMIAKFGEDAVTGIEIVGIDNSPSTPAVSTKKVSFKQEISKGLHKNIKEKRRTQRAMDRSRRAMNPEKFDEKGRIRAEYTRKGKKKEKSDKKKQKMLEKKAKKLVDSVKDNVSQKKVKKAKTKKIKEAVVKIESPEKEKPNDHALEKIKAAKTKQKLAEKIKIQNEKNGTNKKDTKTEIKKALKKMTVTNRKYIAKQVSTERATKKEDSKTNKAWKKSNSYLKKQTEFQDKERRLTAHKKSLRGCLINDILAFGHDVRIEKVNYKAWQKNYGKSMGWNAPAMFEHELTRKAAYARGQRKIIPSLNDDGGILNTTFPKAGDGKVLSTKINTYDTALSQHCICGAKHKKALWERKHQCTECGYGTKQHIDRDELSAFLAIFTTSVTEKIQGKDVVHSYLDIEEARLLVKGHRTLAPVDLDVRSDVSTNSIGLSERSGTQEQKSSPPLECSTQKFRVSIPRAKTKTRGNSKSRSRMRDARQEAESPPSTPRA